MAPRRRIQDKKFLLERMAYSPVSSSSPVSRIELIIGNDCNYTVNFQHNNLLNDRFFNESVTGKSSLSPDPKSLESLQDENQREPELPDGWVSVCHDSGGVVYLHKDSRVCTWSRPYILSTSRTAKKHTVPVNSIPCLRQWLESSQEKSECMTRIEPKMFSQYLMTRWPLGFPAIEECRNEAPGSRNGRKKRKRAMDDIIVPMNVSKVITVNIPQKYIKADGHGKRSPSEWSINVNHKPPVSILLEFCQHYLRSEVNYSIQEDENGQMPYKCTAIVGGAPYGKGSGSSKKLSKQAAAKATLELFLPGTFTEIFQLNDSTNKEFAYLSTVSIDDVQSTVYLQQVGLPSPWSILKECYQRMKILGITEPEFKIELHSANDGTTCSSAIQARYTLSCGPEYTVTGLCNGRKDGQQLAAQKMLKVLHPDLHTWDTLLNLYIGRQSSSSKFMKVSKDVDSTQSQQGQSSNNNDLLLKLKMEMRALTGQSHTCNC